MAKQCYAKAVLEGTKNKKNKKKEKKEKKEEEEGGNNNSTEFSTDSNSTEPAPHTADADADTNTISRSLEETTAEDETVEEDEENDAGSYPTAPTDDEQEAPEEEGLDEDDAMGNCMSACSPQMKVALVRAASMCSDGKNDDKDGHNHHHHVSPFPRFPLFPPLTPNKPSQLTTAKCAGGSSVDNSGCCVESNACPSSCRVTSMSFSMQNVNTENDAARKPTRTRQCVCQLCDEVADEVADDKDKPTKPETPATPTALVGAPKSVKCPNGENASCNAGTYGCFDHSPTACKDKMASPALMCPFDIKDCPDGSTVERDGKNNCEFFSCPTAPVKNPSKVGAPKSITCANGKNVACNAGTYGCVDNSPTLCAAADDAEAEEKRCGKSWAAANTNTHAAAGHLACKDNGDCKAQGESCFAPGGTGWSTSVDSSDADSTADEKPATNTNTRAAAAAATATAPDITPAITPATTLATGLSVAGESCTAKSQSCPMAKCAVPEATTSNKYSKKGNKCTILPNPLVRTKAGECCRQYLCPQYDCDEKEDDAEEEAPATTATALTAPATLPATLPTLTATDNDPAGTDKTGGSCQCLEYNADGTTKPSAECGWKLADGGTCKAATTKAECAVVPAEVFGGTPPIARFQAGAACVEEEEPATQVNDARKLLQQEDGLVHRRLRRQTPNSN